MTNVASSDRRRVVVLGASGCVGAAAVGLLDDRSDLQLLLVARDPQRLEAVARGRRTACRVVPADLTDQQSFDAMLAVERPEVIVNCSGRYREHGMLAARAAVKHGISLIDIADEPVYLEDVLQLGPAAAAARCRLIIGSGTAPQATGALLKLAAQTAGPGGRAIIAACFGINRVGPNAVRTAAEAVAGLIALPSSPRSWTPGERVPFRAPFGPIRARHYPLPETVCLPAMKDVASGFIGVALPTEWQNRTIAFLKRIGFARWLTASRMLNPVCSTIAAVETWMAARGIGAQGIGLYAAVTGPRGTVETHLYDPDMTGLTARALVGTLDHLLDDRSDAWGLHLAQDYIEPVALLNRLHVGGTEWSIVDSRVEAAAVPA